MRRLIASRISTAPLPRRSGLTLIELLAVISVLAILLSVAIPVIRPALKDRKLRESARLLNAYVAGVQARATELGRPVGIVLVRGNSGKLALGVVPNDRDPYQCTEIFTAEVPQPYAGDLVDSRAIVKPSGITFTHSLFFSTLLKNGDLFSLRLDHKDPLYLCKCTGANTAIFRSFDLANPSHYQKRLTGVPFQIYRTPTRSSAASLQLPSGTAIDLSVSGFGDKVRAFSPPNSRKNITIMFSPNGSIDSVFIDDTPSYSLSKIYLLLGRVNQIETNSANLFLEDPKTDLGGKKKGSLYRSNAMDPVNYWFTINPRNGYLRNSINRPDMVAEAANLTNKIGQARTDAIEGISVGGR